MLALGWDGEERDGKGREERLGNGRDGMGKEGKRRGKNEMGWQREM